MRITRAGVAGVGAAVVLIAGAGMAAGKPDPRLGTFLAGCVVLSWSASMDIRQKMDWYARLSAAAGLTPAQARQMIEKYRDRPADWSAVLQQARETLEKTP